MNHKLEVLLSPRQTMKNVLFRTSKLWPDKLYLQVQCFVMTGKFLNLKNPKTYRDKLNWLKLNYHNPAFCSMVHKYEAKKYVSDVLGENVAKDLIIPAYGVYDSFDEIDFGQLPDKFMLKCTHDSGSVVPCLCKATFDKKKARKKLEFALNRSFYYIHREWPYKDCKHQIIAEELIDELANPDTVLEYKVTCCNGKVAFITICTGEAHGPISGRTNDHFTVDKERLDFKVVFDKSRKPVSFPPFWEKLIDYSEKLAKDIPYLRVDWYDISGKLMFGEMTFYTWGGQCLFEPESWNEWLGEKIELPTLPKNQDNG